MKDWPPTWVNIPKEIKKKAFKKTIRGVTCTCGAIDKYWTTISYLHDKECIINTSTEGAQL